MLIVVFSSATVAALTLLLAPRPDPANLVEFYRRVRPLGWWGPVQRLAGVSQSPGELAPIAAGLLGSVGLMIGGITLLGGWLFDRPMQGLLSGIACLAGLLLVRRALKGLRPQKELDSGGTQDPVGRLK